MTRLWIKLSVLALVATFATGCIVEDGDYEEDVASAEQELHEGFGDREVNEDILLDENLVNPEPQPWADNDLEQNSFAVADGTDEGDDDDEEGSNPEPQPWRFQGTNPEPQPWQGGMDGSDLEPSPLPWTD